MKFAFILFQKELMGFVRDKRAVMVNFFFPVLIFPVFLMLLAILPLAQKGEALGTAYRFEIEHNDDPEFRSLLTKSFPVVDPANEVSLSIRFPEGFPNGAGHGVEIGYSSEDGRQVLATEKLKGVIAEYETAVTNHRLTTLGLDTGPWQRWTVQLKDSAPLQYRNNEKTATILPYIIVLLLMISGLGVGMDATAGEKERGGLLLLLSNSVPRFSIALGKILFVLFCSIANGIASCVGLVIAVGFSTMTGSTFSLAGPYDGGQLTAALLLIVTTGALFASVIVLIGSWSSSMKEAAGFSMPFNLFVLLISTVGTLMDGRTNAALGFVPFLNFFIAFKDLLVGRMGDGQWLVASVVNLVFAAGVILIIARLYRSEKILR